jgi:hypothetical protein
MKNFHPISFYLNQKFVFDILAILEDGFSEMQNLKTSSTIENEKERGVNGEIGLSNAFAFLGVSIGGQRKKNTKEGDVSESEFKKVHTPNSLFAKMREILFKKKLVRTHDLINAKPGEFVEFKATLRKNPIIGNLESYFSLFKFGIMFQDKPTTKEQRAEQTANKKMIEQFESLVQELKQGANIDLIGEIVGKENINSVLTIDNNFLNDPSLSDIADGEFTVFGKIIKVLPESSNDKINLLRKTSLSKLNEALLNQMFSGFQNFNEDDGLTNSEFIKEIESPAIQVIPISIFT